MKKGFTLIELLGVIMIIAIIATIVAIAVDNSIKKGKVTTCLAQEENIIEAAKNWQIDTGNYSNCNLTISTLKSAGYIDSNLKNPMTNVLYTNQTYVEIKAISGGNNKQNYSYKIVYQNEQKCE